jgi:hypothetical protein
LLEVADLLDVKLEDLVGVDGDAPDMLHRRMINPTMYILSSFFH